jgi:hypothetical protein
MQCSWLCSASLSKAAETYMKYRTSRKRTAANLNFPGRLADGALRKLLVAGFALAALANVTLAQESKRDAFFWLGQINKASAVINTDEGLLDKAMAPKIARGLQSVLAAGDAPNGKRPGLVITFEPLLIEAAGVEATLLHAGRSSQGHAGHRALRHTARRHAALASSWLRPVLIFCGWPRPMPHSRSELYQRGCGPAQQLRALSSGASRGL